MASWLGSPEFKVGVLVVGISALIGGMALKVAEGPSVLFGKRTYYFRADSAGGLIPNSAVKMAGIKIGVIEDIILENGRAKIVVAVEGDSRITESGFAYLKADGILGDKHVEIDPGKPDDTDLPGGSEIKLTQAGGGMDDVMAEVNRVAKQMNELMDTLNGAIKAGDQSTTIGRIMANVETLTSDLKEVTSENKDQLRTIMTRVANLTKNLDTYINEESLARVDRSLRNIEDITNKMAKGEGTLGRLINDEETVEELNSAITNVNKFLGGADKLETSFDFHSEYLGQTGQTKSFLGLKIQPGLDRYYEVQVVDDPEGVTTSKTQISSSNGGAEDVYNEQTTQHNKLKLTAIFAKNFYDSGTVKFCLPRATLTSPVC